jgi:hypothetical protein
MVGTTVWLGARRTLLLPAAWRPGPPLPPAAMMLCTRFQLRNAATDTTSELIKTAVLVEKAYAELQLKNIQHQVPIVAVPPPSSSSSSSSSSSPFCKPLHQAHRHSFPEASKKASFTIVAFFVSSCDESLLCFGFCFWKKTGLC